MVQPPKGWEGDLHFQTSKGHNIRYGYAPAEGQSRGAIIVTHGYGEDIDLYYETIKRYQRMDYDVYAMDWHGQGASGRVNPRNLKQPSTEGMRRHVDDLDVLARQVVKPHNGDKPLIMSTNSMGGHVGMIYLHDHPDVFDGAIMSTPMLDINPLGLPRTVFKPLMRAIFNVASHVGFKNTKTASSWEALEKTERRNSNKEDKAEKPVNARREIAKLLGRMNEDQRLSVPTFGWVHSTFATVDMIMDESYLRDINVPILIGSAEEESFVENSAHEKAAEIMPLTKNVLIKGADHTLWQELGRTYDEWWGHVVELIQDVEARVHEDRRYEPEEWCYQCQQDKNPADEYRFRL